MTRYEITKQSLLHSPKRWLITGVAGFIGSNLLEELLRLNQEVVGLDNFLTGRMNNLEEVRSIVTPEQWDRFTFVEGDIRDTDVCRQVCGSVDCVLHEAALGSVSRSIEDPIATNENNATGFLNMLTAAKDLGVKRFVYASSSSVYGDHLDLPKVEEKIGNPLSPYGATKRMNEMYANVFAHVYGFKGTGLRYFNVFGPRQDPGGPYAAVIPRWFSALDRGDEVCIYGDGETSRDFCYVGNVVQANILAACTDSESALGLVYNVACGGRSTLKELFEYIRAGLAEHSPHARRTVPVFREFRPGDIRHSLADIGRARELLGYEPEDSLQSGLKKMVTWYLERGRK